jgi:hypothetical protein
LSLSLLVAILFLLCFLKQTETIRSEKSSELADAHRQNSSRGSGDHYSAVGCWRSRFSFLNAIQHHCCFSSG